MRRFVLGITLAVASVALLAQNPESASGGGQAAGPGQASSPVPKTFEFKDDAGLSYFTYTYPSDWDVVDSKPMMPVVRQKVEEGAQSDMEKRGAECTQLALLLRNPAKGSTIVVIAIQYQCIGAAINENDLPAAATGVAEGMKKNFDIADPAYGAYKLGSHNFWIERAKATPKSHPETMVTLETACTMLKKAMVCWMGFARDRDALNVFESGLTSLDGDPPLALVPATAFANQPK